MLAWGISTADWYTLPRSERAFKKALVNAKSLIEAMQQHDQREDAEREAKLEAKRERRGGR